MLSDQDTCFDVVRHGEDHACREAMSAEGLTKTNRHVQVTSGFTPTTDINLARCNRSTPRNDETTSALGFLKWHLATAHAAKGNSFFRYPRHPHPMTDALAAG